jgi:mannose-6-phosphate isomerase-like protein (cupin superfamily)
MRRIFASVLITGAIFATAAMAADDYVVMPKSSRVFTPGAGGFARQQSLLNHKNSQASSTIRDKDGQAEVHAGWEDHMFIFAGEASLVLGGTVENGKTTAPGETRGDSIKGGKTIVLHPEDYIFIPVNTPHQMLVAPGKTIRYAVVKTHP